MISAWWLILAFVVGQVSTLFAVALLDGAKERGEDGDDE